MARHVAEAMQPQKLVLQEQCHVVTAGAPGFADGCKAINQ